LKKEAAAEVNLPPKRQPNQRTKDQELDTGSPEDKSPDDMEIYE